MLYAFDNQEIQKFQRVTSPSDATDAELMSRIGAGDDEALTALFSRHGAMLRTIINRCVSNQSDADDILQQCMLDVWQRASHYDPAKGQPLGWLITLARRRAIDWVRRRSSYERGKDRFSAECMPETVEDSAAEKDAASHDMAEILSKLISRLPVEQQEVIRLAFYHGMSQRQVAAHTGKPLGTIKTRIELGLNKLRSAAMAMGGRKGEFVLA